MQHGTNSSYVNRKCRCEECGEARKSYKRAYDLRSRYGITVTDYEHLLEKQGGACAICLRGFNSRTAEVDHCHTTGKVRGLLCKPCNLGLGHARDNPEIILKALQYLDLVN